VEVLNVEDFKLIGRSKQRELTRRKTKMLKLKNISPSHGESYFEKDNYFSSDDNRAASEWWGKETAALGLKGEVDRRMFSKMLRGQAPSGEKLRIGVRTGSERAGIDCTFSAPKSVSLLALVASIRAVFEAHRLAILDALKQMENYAMTRVTVEGKRQRVETGNLVIAIHHHDTNRELEPQLHVATRNYNRSDLKSSRF